MHASMILHTPAKRWLDALSAGAQAPLKGRLPGLHASHRWARPVALLAILALTWRLPAADWPYYRGPQGSGVCPEPIQTEWPAEGPPVLWRAPLNHGFSSMTVVGGKIFTLVKRNVGPTEYEFCLALDSGDGAELWATPLTTAEYASGASGPSGGSDGPRSTPVVHGGRVFVLDRELTLWCLDAGDGHTVWSKDIAQLYGGVIPTWEYAASPVIDDDRLFLNCGGSGGSLLSLRTSDGGLLWKTRSDGVTYSTPVCAVIHGVKQVVFLASGGLRSLRPEDGQLLWRHDYGNTEMFIASPVVAGDIVYASAGYSVGAVAVRITYTGGQFQATRLWRATGDFMNHWTSCVQRDGYLYGLFGHGEYNDAPLKCIDLQDGQEMWSAGGFGQGGLILAGARLVVLGAKRDLVVVEADPAAYREVSRITPFNNTSGKCWNAPAVSDGVLFVRSTREVVALDVQAPAPPPIRFADLSRVDGSRLRIVIRGADGGAIDPARADRIEVLTSTVPGTPPDGWTKIDSPLSAQDGSLTLEYELSPGERTRFFLAVENP